MGIQFRDQRRRQGIQCLWAIKFDQGHSGPRRAWRDERIRRGKAKLSSIVKERPFELSGKHRVTIDAVEGVLAASGRV